MLIRTILKLPVILFVLENSSVVIFAQSLFDDLPENGAILLDNHQNIHNSHYIASDSRSGRKLLKPTLKHSSTNGNLRNIRDSTTARTIENISLFDSLPNQGALTLSAEENPSRNTRDSVFTRLLTNPELQQQISQDFVLDSSDPVSKSDYTFFNSHLIPHIRHQVMSPTIVPVITGPTAVSSTIIPIVSNKYNGGYNNQQYHHTISKDEFEDTSHSSSDSGKSYVSASAKSGGPTVIVYAHPHTKGNQNPNSDQGALPPAPPERNNFPGKNEIHYHYHLPTTTTQSPHYGPPPSRNHPNNNHDNSHHSNNNHNNHQSNNNHNNNHNNHQSNNNHNNNHNNHQSNNNHNNNHNNHQSNNNHNNHHQSNNSHNNHHNRPPSSQYGSPEPPPSTTRRPSSGGSGSYPSSRINVSGISLTEEQSNDFNHRTFFTPAKYQSSESYPSSNSYSPGWQPKTTASTPSLSYESPPSFDAPQPPPSYDHSYSGYAPPPNSEAYGPPQTPPPPPAPQNDPPLPPAPAPPTESHQTSISYQTIPVTHQVTEFVQVPTITQTLINHSPAPSGSPLPVADAPVGGGPPPPSSYGPPNPGRTLNVQTAQTTSNSAAVDRSMIAEDQLNRLLLASSPTSRENSLSDLLLLTQGGRGSNDLSLVELQLLAAANRGSGFSNNNFQNPILNPLRGGRGRFSNALPVVNSGFRTNGPLGGGNNFNSLSFANGGGIRNFGLQGNNLNGHQFSNQQVTGTDTASAIHELIREQRIQGALNDLRGRLRDQSRGADRERQNYRNLFYKGALLLSALTLLPTVATPMAAAAAANSAASVLPSFMMPLTIGRRKRSLFKNSQLTPFEKCLEKIKFKYSNDTGHLHGKYHSNFHQWLNCSNKLAIQDGFESKRVDLTNNSRNIHGNTNHSKVNQVPPLPILESNKIRDDLKKYLSMEDILSNSKCIQKYFCTNLQAIKRATSDDNLYNSMFPVDILNTNIWIKEAFEAAKQNMCDTFHCYEDEIK